MRSRLVSRFVLGLALAMSSVSAIAQDDQDNPAPPEPIVNEPGDLLFNATIELRRPPVVEAEHDANATAAETTDETPVVVEKSDEKPLTNPPVESKKSLESTMPLGADSGLFSLGGSNESTESESSTPTWMAGVGGEFTRTLGGLAVVLGLLLGLYLLVRRFGGPMAGAKRPAGVLEIMARYPIGRRQHLVLLKMGRRIILLHQTGTEMRTLSDVHDPDEVADLIARIESGSRDSRFSDALERESSTYGGVDRDTAQVSTVRRGNQDVEMVDLTRTSGRWRRVLPRWGVNA